MALNRIGLVCCCFFFKFADIIVPLIERLVRHGNRIWGLSSLKILAGHHAIA